MKRSAPLFIALLIVLSTAGVVCADVETTLYRGAFYLSVKSAATTATGILYSDAIDPDIVDQEMDPQDAQEKSIAFGVALEDGKVGLEFTEISFPDDKSDAFKISTIMLDASYNNALAGPLNYYLGAGIGAVAISLDILGEKDEISRLSYKFRGGVMVDVSHFLSLELGYSYLLGSDFELGTSSGSWSGNLVTRGVTAGVSFYF